MVILLLSHIRFFAVRCAFVVAVLFVCGATSVGFAAEPSDITPELIQNWIKGGGNVNQSKGTVGRHRIL